MFGSSEKDPPTQGQTTQRATQVKTGADWLAVGKPDPGQPANLGDGVEALRDATSEHRSQSKARQLACRKKNLDRESQRRNLP